MSIDLSQFKKIESGDKHTVLQHPSGHTIKIAHKGLSGELRKELDRVTAKMAKGGEAGYTPESGLDENESQDSDLPCRNKSCNSYGSSHPNCKCYGGYADGGQAENFCSKDNVHKNGCEYFDAGGEAQGVPAEPAPEVNVPASDVPQAPQDAQPSQNPETQSSVPAGAQPDQVPSAPDVPAPVEQFQAQKGQHLNQMLAENKAFQNDLDAGHIKPETYHDLFAKKDTLGKIGTMFGLLVGGGGAGLTHQPNALISMMDNQIKNDLDAQKQSVTNKQNFLKINQQGLVNNASINATNTDTAIKSYAQGLSQMNLVAFHKLVSDTQKLPPGPQRDAQERTLAMMGPVIQNANVSILDKAATAAAAANVFGGGQQNGAQPNTTLMKSGLAGPEMKEMGQDIEQKTIPGVPGRATIPVPQDKRNEIQAMNVLDNKASDLLSFAKQHKGSIDPSVIKVGKQKAEEMLNYYNSSIQGGVLTEGRLKWLDEQIKKNPTSVFQDILGNNAQLNEIKNSNANRRDMLLQSYGFKHQSSGPATKTVNGVKYTKGPNGEAIKVK